MGDDNRVQISISESENQQSSGNSRVDSSTLRIGLISDTHEADDPVELTRSLKTLDCDWYVHLGDVGGSKSWMQAVRAFKQSMGALEGLSEAQRQDYQQRLQGGASHLRAYAESVLGLDPAGNERRLAEIKANYLAVLNALGEFEHAYCLTGNVDRALFKGGVIEDVRSQYPVTLVTTPLWLDHGDSAVVFWPSMRVENTDRARRLNAIVNDFVERGADKARIVILAHEQIFKGPPPRVYKHRIQAAGLDAVTIPWYEPNPTRHYLGEFLRRLSPQVEITFVFGHVHDPLHVIQAGVPHLLSDHRRLGLRYRLYGLGNNVIERDRGLHLRRQLTLYYVPIERLARLSIGSRGVSWEEIHP
jgi:hypothetical protein